MNDRTESAQNIKGFTAVNITEDKTTRVRRVLRISLNGLAFGNDVFDFRQGNTAAVTASLAMPRDLKRAVVNFSSDFFNHRIIFSRQRVTQEVWGCQAIRHSFGTFASNFAVFRVFRLDPFDCGFLRLAQDTIRRTLSEANVQDQP